MDPRQRTKNHARLEFTLWVNVPDNALKHSKRADAATFLREMETAMKADFERAIELINDIPFVGEIEFKVETRVSQ